MQQYIWDYSGFYLTHFPELGSIVDCSYSKAYGRMSSSDFSFSSFPANDLEYPGTTYLMDFEDGLKITANMCERDGSYFYPFDVLFRETDGLWKYCFPLIRKSDEKMVFISVKTRLRLSTASTSEPYYITTWGIFENIADAITMEWVKSPLLAPEGVHCEVIKANISGRHSSITIKKVYADVVMRRTWKLDDPTQTDPNAGFVGFSCFPRMINFLDSRGNSDWLFPGQAYLISATTDLYGYDYAQPTPPGPEPSTKGEYPGMPTSRIPLRNTFGDLNFRHCIQIYDESNNEQNCMFLNRPIGTLDYSYIEFTESGSLIIRSKDYHSFTHFAGLGLNNENQYPLIYRVTQRKIIAKDVVEVWYEIDGRKTFFQYYGINSNNPIVTRSTNPNGYEPFKTDSALVTGRILNNNYNLRSSISPHYLMRVIGATGKLKYYLLTEAALTTFRINLNAETQQKQFVNQIVGINVIPRYLTGDSYSFSVTSVSGISFSVLDDSDPENPTLTTKTISVSCDELTPSFNTSSTTPDIYIDFYLSGSYHSISDYSELSGIYNMFAPYYGYFGLDQQEILLVANGSSPKIRYYLDIEGGNIAVQLFDSTGRGKLHQFTPMATTSIASRDLETIRYANESNDVSRQSVINSGIKNTVFAIGSGALAGGMTGAAAGGIGAIPGAIAGATLSGITSVANTMFQLTDLQNTNNAQMTHVLNSLTQDNLIASGTISTTCHCVFIQEYIAEKTIPQADYYSVVGYPIDKPWIDVGGVDGHCYWLTFNWAGIRAQYGAIDQVVLDAAKRDLAEPVIYNINVED